MYDAGRREFAAVANAIAAFEPVTLICATAEDEAAARVLVSQAVETIVIPMDGAWVRDNGPTYVFAGGRRTAVSFRFNGWAERHAHRDRDAALGKSIAEALDDPVRQIDLVLEGGGIAWDDSGTVVTTRTVLMHPLRNWHLSPEQATERLREALGARQVIVLPQGLEFDLDRVWGTDGHIDLFFDFVGPKKALMFKVEPGHEDYEHLEVSRGLLRAAGIEVIDFPYISGFSSEVRFAEAPYLNFYICNGAVIVPVCEADLDLDKTALELIGRHLPGRQVVPIPFRAGFIQGGAIHCLTQQVPAHR